MATRNPTECDKRRSTSRPKRYEPAAPRQNEIWVRGVSGKVLAVRDGSERFQTWMRPVHQGSLNGVWRLLVFLSGLVPLLFVVTGITMWAKKRKRRIPMTAMTDEIALTDDEEEA